MTTMREKAIEAAARAHWEATREPSQKPWDHLYDFMRMEKRDYAEPVVDAILAELKEPDQRMESDGAFQIFRGERIAKDDLAAARRVWRGMLSTLTKEKDCG